MNEKVLSFQELIEECLVWTDLKPRTCGENEDDNPSRLLQYNEFQNVILAKQTQKIYAVNIELIN